MPHIIETKLDFDLKHGESIFTKGRFLYETGAVWFPWDRNIGQGIAPPADVEELNLLKCEFYKFKLDAANKYKDKIVDAVDGQRIWCLRYANQSAPDVVFPNWRDDLKRVNKEIKELQKLVDSYKPNPPKLSPRDIQRIETMKSAEKTRTDLQKIRSS